MRKYLDDAQRGVELKAWMACEVNEIINNMPAHKLDLSGMKDGTFIWMDVSTYTTRLSDWNNANGKDIVA